MQIYVSKSNQQLGPFEQSKVLEMISKGELSTNDLGIQQGGKEWQKLEEIFPDTIKNTVAVGEIAPKKSRKGLLLGCGGFFLAALLVSSVLGFFAYRNIFPSGTAENLPEKIGYFTIENPQDLSAPKGNIWGTEKSYTTKYKNISGGYALILLTDYSSESAAETFYATLPTSDWCKDDDPLFISYKKDGVETSKTTYCKSVFVKQKNQIFNVIVLSKSRVDDSKDILDHLPFNAAAVGELKK